MEHDDEETASPGRVRMEQVLRPTRTWALTATSPSGELLEAQQMFSFHTALVTAGEMGDALARTGCDVEVQILLKGRGR